MEKFNEWERTRPTEVKTGAEDVTYASASGLTPETETPAAKPSHSNDPAADAFKPAAESAKHAGLNHESSVSNTDSGLGSPESSSPRPVHEAGPDAEPTGPNSSTANTWEGSRNSTDAGSLDTGGNVR
jgi:hypothetical protein